MMNLNQKSDRPFFTILTAALNSESTIALLVDSVRMQTFKDIEHIIIDGGSRDGTLDIFEKYQSAYPLIWKSEPDQGIADALNKGLFLSRGRYLIVIHADDALLNPYILKNVYSLIKDEREDIVSFPVIFEDSQKGTVLRRPIKWLWWNRFKFIFPHQGCFVHRRVFDSIGGFRKEIRISLDYDFFYRALDHNCTVRFYKFPVARMGGSGIGSVPEFTRERLKEDRLVQLHNEKRCSWRLLQLIFYLAYAPYKNFIRKRNVR